MAKLAKCDNCGATDDWSMVRGRPFLHAGATIRFRSDTGDEDPERTVEICDECVGKLLAKFPNLAPSDD